MIKYITFIIVLFVSTNALAGKISLSTKYDIILKAEALCSVHSEIYSSDKIIYNDGLENVCIVINKECNKITNEVIIRQEETKAKRDKALKKHLLNILTKVENNHG